MRRIITAKTVAAGLAAFIALLYVIPALRGDTVLGSANLIVGSPLGFAAAVESTGVLQTDSPSELVACEIVANVTRLDVCSLRAAFGVPRDVPARIDQAVTFHIRETTGLDAIGTGGNPVIEAFPAGDLSWGLAWFVLAGGLLFWTVRNSRSRPVACFLLPHMTAKSLFLWRGTLSELFERVPFILLSYTMVWAVTRLLLIKHDAYRVRP